MRVPSSSRAKDSPLCSPCAGPSPAEVIFRAQHQIPRVSVSDVAAIAGFHPWKSVESMLEKYLYQDCHELFQLDMSLLGLEVVSEEEELQQILLKVPADGRNALSGIQDRVQREGVDSSAVCQSLLQQTKSVLDRRDVAAALSVEEAEFVREHVRSSVHTGYGNTREEDVLSAYEQETGYSVQSRNDKFLIAPIMSDVASANAAGTTTSVAIAVDGTTNRVSEDDFIGDEFSTEETSSLAPITPHLQDHFMRYATPEERTRMQQKQRYTNTRVFFSHFLDQLVTTAGTASFIPTLKSLVQTQGLHHRRLFTAGTDARNNNRRSEREANACGLQLSSPLIVSSHSRYIALPFVRSLPSRASNTDVMYATDGSDHVYGSATAVTSSAATGTGIFGLMDLDVLHVTLDMCETVIKRHLSRDQISKRRCSSENLERKRTASADSSIGSNMHVGSGASSNGRGGDVLKRMRLGMCNALTCIRDCEDGNDGGSCDCGDAVSDNNSTSNGDGNNKEAFYTALPSGSRSTLTVHGIQFSTYSEETAMMLLSVLRDEKEKNIISRSGNSQCPLLLFSPTISDFNHDCDSSNGDFRCLYRSQQVRMQDTCAGTEENMLNNVEVIDLTGDEATSLPTFNQCHSPQPPSQKVSELFPITVWLVTESSVPVTPFHQFTHFVVSAHPNAHSPTATATLRRNKPLVYPAFYLIGIVDGLSEQLDTSATCASQWTPETIVVEAKCRVSAVRSAPPLYDLIQLVTYLLILQLKTGDLVEYNSTRTGPLPPSATTLSASSTAGIIDLDIETEDEALPPAAEVIDPLSLRITRVTLSCPVYRHAHHWHQSILPALRSFVTVLRRLRGDDTLRYQWLMLLTACAVRDSARREEGEESKRRFVQDLMSRSC